MHDLLKQQIALFLEDEAHSVPAEFLRAVDLVYRRANVSADFPPDAQTDPDSANPDSRGPDSAESVSESPASESLESESPASEDPAYEDPAPAQLDAEASEPLDEQMRQAQKMEAVGRLAGGIAHDFNNLLTVIKGYCDLCTVEVETAAPVADYLAEIRRAANRAADLTGQLLAFSRQQVMQPKVIDLNEGIRDLRRMLVRVIGATVDLRFDLTDETPTVHADEGQIQQVLMNLVINARDAMPDGGLITISTEMFEIDEEFAAGFDYPIERGPTVVLRVRDTGEGMDPNVKAHIFEPFFTTKELGKGTGLGLSTVYGIVKQSGGYIWVDSKPGLGTEFRIYLPWVEEDELDDESGVGPRRRRSGGEHVLVVEDEAPVRKILCRVLHQAGYRVFEATGAADALRRYSVEPERLDMLVTDIVMPEMDGYELAELLQAARPDLQVLYISGYSPDAYETKGILRSGSNFLQKPFDADTLTLKIQDVLNTS